MTIGEHLQRRVKTIKIARWIIGFIVFAAIYVGLRKAAGERWADSYRTLQFPAIASIGVAWITGSFLAVKALKCPQCGESLVDQYLAPTAIPKECPRCNISFEQPWM